MTVQDIAVGVAGGIMVSAAILFCARMGFECAKRERYGMAVFIGGIAVLFASMLIGATIR